MLGIWCCKFYSQKGFGNTDQIISAFEQIG